MNNATEKRDFERSVYNWGISDFSGIFRELNQKRKIERTGRRNGKEKHVDSSDTEIVSETFMRGQLVEQTSIWQIELRRNGAYLSVGLSCLECFHENVNEIWTRFDIDIVDFNGEICHSQNTGAHFCSDNVTKFTPLTKIRNNRTTDSGTMKCSFWETDAISMNDIVRRWNELIRVDILNLRLRLYIYRCKPFDEASHIAEYHEPVKLCYTDGCSSQLMKNSLSKAVQRLWETRQGADVTFVIEGVEIKAHKLILSIQCPVLETIMMSKTKDETIEIHAMSPKVFEQILKYFYTQDAKDLKESSDVPYTASVLEACNKLQVASLARICLVRLLTNMNVENFAEIAFIIYSKVTLEHSFFKTEVKKFMMENQKELRKSTAFQKKSQEDVAHFLQLCFEPLNLSRPSA